MALEVVGGFEAKDGISRLTTEYLYWPLTTDDDFSAATASAAFLETNTSKPGSADWVTAEVVTNPDDVTSQAVRLLVGPELTGYDLTPATSDTLTYYVWVKLATSTEVIVRRAGTLQVR